MCLTKKLNLPMGAVKARKIQSEWEQYTQAVGKAQEKKSFVRQGPVHQGWQQQHREAEGKAGSGDWGAIETALPGLKATLADLESGAASTATVKPADKPATSTVKPADKPAMPTTRPPEKPTTATAKPAEKPAEKPPTTTARPDPAVAERAAAAERERVAAAEKAQFEIEWKRYEGKCAKARDAGLDLDEPCAENEAWKAAVALVTKAQSVPDWPGARRALGDLDGVLGKLTQHAVVRKGEKAKEAEAAKAKADADTTTVKPSAPLDPYEAYVALMGNVKSYDEFAAYKGKNTGAPPGSIDRWNAVTKLRSAAHNGKRWEEALQHLQEIEALSRKILDGIAAHKAAEKEKADADAAAYAAYDQVLKAAVAYREFDAYTGKNDGAPSGSIAKWNSLTQQRVAAHNNKQWGEAKRLMGEIETLSRQILDGIALFKSGGKAPTQVTPEPETPVTPAKVTPDTTGTAAKAKAAEEAAAKAKADEEALKAKAAEEAKAKQEQDAAKLKQEQEAAKAKQEQEAATAVASKPAATLDPRDAYDAVRKGAKAYDEFNAYPGPNTGAPSGSIDQWNALNTKHGNAARGKRWPEAKKHIEDLELLSRQILDGIAAYKADTAAKQLQYEAYKKVLDAATDFNTFNDRTAPNTGAASASLARWGELTTKWINAHNGSRWVEAKDLVVELDPLGKEILAQIAARTDYDAAEAKATAFKDYEAHAAEYGKAVLGTLPFFATRDVWRTAYNSGQWGPAKDQLAALEAGAKDIQATKLLYDQFITASTAAMPKRSVDDAERFYDAGKGSGRIRDEWGKRYNALSQLKSEKRWVDAKAGFAALVEASKRLVAEVGLLDQYDKATKDDITAADATAQYALESGPAAGAYRAYLAARETFNKALLADDFTGAKLALATLKTNAATYKTALESNGPNDKKAYETAWATVEPKLKTATDLKTALKAGVPALEAEWRVLNAADTVRAAAVKAVHWRKALAPLGALDRSATRFAAIHAEYVAFDTRYSGLKPAVAAASAIAAEALPHLAVQAKAFSDQRQATQALMDAGSFTPALGTLAALERLAKALTDADARGGGKGTPGGNKLRSVAADAKALRARVATLAVGLGAPAQQLVITPLDACTRHIAAGPAQADAAGAEYDKAKKAYDTALAARRAEWETFYAQAKKDVDAAKADAAGLAQKLKDLQAKGIEATRVSIDKAVTKGHYGSATAKAKTWADEARAWAQAADAAKGMQPGQAPDVEKLKELAAKTGGGKVIDALVAGLMAENKAAPGQMKAALEARFGFKAKRFAVRKKGVAESDERNVAELPGGGPDKSLEQTYQVLAKVPQNKWAGKVDDLITYDADEGDVLGGHYSSGAKKKKIYMYCGRPQDGKEQTFGKAQKLLPEGESVEEDCQPTSEDAVNLFDFTLLHEAGHAEDDQAGYMGRNGKAADHGGWQAHAGPEDFVDLLVTRFGYDKTYILATLKSPNGAPPAEPATMPSGKNADAWEKARADVVAWCQSVRADAQPWENASLSRAVALGGRVYQEAYAGKWVSYDVGARARGISSYQFRAPGEWFAELYAAYFSKKLKPNHPSAAWLKTFKSPAAQKA